MTRTVLLMILVVVSFVAGCIFLAVGLQLLGWTG